MKNVYLDSECEPCKGSDQKASEEDQQLWLKELDGWQIVDKKGVKQLLKVYKTNNFLSSLSLAQQIGELAEKVDHHPALLVEWGSLTVRWWTHSLRGLHKNDFIMAKKTSEHLKTV